MLDLISLWSDTVLQNSTAEQPSRHYLSDTKQAAIKF